VSSKSGPVVFTATPEMAKQMPKIFKVGATYVAQRAAAVSVGDTSSSPAKATRRRATKKVATKKASKPKRKKKVTKKAAKKTPKKKKVTKKQKKTTKKAPKKKVKAGLKVTKRRPIKPEIIIQYVNDNAGCNMTDIERSTKMPQTAIRRVLNSARDAGAIRTEGQRRGLRYFAGSEDAKPVAAATSDTPPWTDSEA